jgi:CPA2 family monovalent cation:H+ antiporter-2
MIMSESPLSQQAAQESLPLRDAFSVLFFVSVGMLFNPLSVLDNPWPVVATLAIIVIGKSAAAFLIVLAYRHPIGTALMISASLAQIGEFSFILAELGVGLGLLPEAGRDLILAGAILSILLNPLAFAAVDRLKALAERRAAEPEAGGQAVEPSTAGAAARGPGELDAGGPPVRTGLSGHTILVGYGRVGSLVGESLRKAAVPFLVVEDADKAVTALRADGIEVIAGNAAGADVFSAANPEEAKTIVLAIPNAFEAGQMVQRAKTANPATVVIARAHSDAEVEHLSGLGADIVIMGEREIARGIVDRLRDDGVIPAG